MLLIIKNCKPDSYANDTNRMSALINLLASHGLRKNIVIASKETLDCIMDSNLYSKNDRQYSADILESRREHSLLKNSLLIYGIIDFDLPANQTSVENLNNRYQITIGHDFFLSPRNAEATPIITENDNDFNLYSVIGNYYSKYVLELKLGINLEHHLGAGSHSKAQFDRLSLKHPFLLCLVDNDKPHPEKGEGNTSLAFKALDRKFNSGQLAKVINIREIESIIPIHIIKEVFSYGNATVINALDEFCALANTNIHFRTYFDHKDGLNLEEAIKLDDKHGDFWLPILSKIDRFTQKDCFKTKVCTNCGQCPEIKGLGDSLLASSNKSIDKSNQHKIKDLIEEPLKNTWAELGEYILGWGCVSKNRLTRS